MSDTAIRLEGISKRYHIGRIQERNGYKTLRELMTNAFMSPLHRAGNLLRGRATGAAELDKEIWALDDVSFKVRHGEAIGIIGRNGTGKSTLLKILSRITEPTRGWARIRGKVGSLLEVGTGFHNELTGRENIYLNGSILGMKHREIKQKFDEIVAFSGIEAFLDTPVKHYSTGMYIRLAFAVAAHLEPDIMVVDEVLAVGDAEFQKKCLGKMQDVAREGRTVLFVSHNMRAIKTLCRRAILLENGTPVMDDLPEAVITSYLSKGVPDQSVIEWKTEDAPRTDEFVLRGIAFLNKDGSDLSNLSTADPIVVEIKYNLLTPLRGLRVHFKLTTQDGITIFASSDALIWPESRPYGHYISKCIIPAHLLNVGMYVLAVGVDIPGFKAVLRSREYLKLTVSELMENPMGLSARAPVGIICPKLEWTVNKRG